MGNEFLDKNDLSRSLCPMLEFVKLNQCEIHGEGLKLWEDAKDYHDFPELTLRVTFEVGYDMIYEVYIIAVIRLTQEAALHVIVKDIFNWRPRSLYRDHESCTPAGIDPATFLCASSTKK